METQESERGEIVPVVGGPNDGTTHRCFTEEVSWDAVEWDGILRRHFYRRVFDPVRGCRVLLYDSTVTLPASL